MRCTVPECVRVGEMDFGLEPPTSSRSWRVNTWKMEHTQYCMVYLFTDVQHNVSIVASNFDSFHLKYEWNVDATSQCKYIPLHRKTCTAFSIAIGCNVQNGFVFSASCCFDIYCLTCLLSFVSLNVPFCFANKQRIRMKTTEKRDYKKLVIMMSKMAECKWWIFFLHPHENMLPKKKLLFVSRIFHLHIRGKKMCRKCFKCVCNAESLQLEMEMDKFIRRTCLLWCDANKRKVLWLHIASEFNYLALIS